MHHFVDLAWPFGLQFAEWFEPFLNASTPVHPYAAKEVDGRVNDVQELLVQLKANGWTLAAIADEMGTHYNTVQKWSAGHRSPANSGAVIQVLEGLLRRRRVPKQRRYGPDAPQRRPRKDPAES